MKLKYVKELLSDGSYPSVQLLTGETVDLPDGTLDVDGEQADALLETGNFEEVGVVESDKEALVARARELGINANRSWGEAKLRDAIANKEAAEAEAAPVAEEAAANAEVQ